VWETEQVEVTHDEAIAAIAATQHGIVTREQLLIAGVGRGATDHRVACGRLHPVHRGIYLVGHAVAPPLAPEVAAVYACGTGAVLSHRSAAWLWGLAPRPRGPVEVTVPGRDGRRPGVRVHRARRLEPADRTTRESIPVTAPARTLLDLAEVASARELERAMDGAESRRLVRRRALEELMARTPGRRGARALAALLAREGGPTLTRSEAEERMLALVRTARLPRPRVNARLGRHEVDLLWKAQRLVVEVDGYAFHSSPAAFERDRLRDAELNAAGWGVMRITWRQLTGEPEAVVARLAAALARGSAEDGP